MKFVILAAIVAVAFAADGDKCKVDTPTVDLSTGNVALKGNSAAGDVAKCATGTFTAAKAATANVEADLIKALKALTTAKAPASAANADATIAAIVGCKAGYAGTVKYSCLTTGAISFTGCTEVTTKCASKVAAGGSGDTAYVAFGSDNSKLGTKATGVCTSPKNTGTVTSTCTGANAWTTVNGCNASAKWWGTCPVPTCGDAKTTSTTKCDATAGQAMANCGADTLKTTATFDCVADATSGTCTAPQCDEKTVWTAGARNAAACTASNAAAKKVAAGSKLGGYTCTIRCKSGKARTGINKAARTCLLVADTEAVWVKDAATGGGGGGSSASTLSLFAAFAVVAAYLA